MSVGCDKQPKFKIDANPIGWKTSDARIWMDKTQARNAGKNLRISELTDWLKYTSKHLIDQRLIILKTSQSHEDMRKKWTNYWVYKWCNDEISPNLLQTFSKPSPNLDHAIKFVKLYVELYARGNKRNTEYGEKTVIWLKKNM